MTAALKLHRPRDKPSSHDRFCPWLIPFLRAIADSQGMTGAELQKKLKGGLTRGRQACYALQRQGLIEDSGLRRHIAKRGTGGIVYTITRQGKLLLAQRKEQP